MNKPNNPNGDASTIEYMLASFARQSRELVASVQAVIALDEKSKQSDKKSTTNIGNAEPCKGM